MVLVVGALHLPVYLLRLRVLVWGIVFELDSLLDPQLLLILFSLLLCDLQSQIQLIHHHHLHILLHSLVPQL